MLCSSSEGVFGGRERSRHRMRRHGRKSRTWGMSGEIGRMENWESWGRDIRTGSGDRVVQRLLECLILISGVNCCSRRLTLRNIWNIELLCRRCRNLIRRIRLRCRLCSLTRCRSSLSLRLSQCPWVFTFLFLPLVMSFRMPRQQVHPDKRFRTSDSHRSKRESVIDSKREPLPLQQMQLGLLLASENSRNLPVAIEDGSRIVIKFVAIQVIWSTERCLSKNREEQSVSGI